MFFNRKIVLSFSIIFFLLPQTIRASTIFSDNFEDGDVSDWTVTRNKQWSSPSSKCRNGNSDANWEVVDGALGIKINGPSCVTEVVPNLWSGSLSRYVIDLDTKFVAGNDKNLAFRYDSPNRWYGLKFNSVFGTVEYQQIPFDGSLYSVNYAVPNGATYHIKTLVDQGKVTTWINDNLVIERVFDPQTEFSPTGKLALQASVGSDPSSEVYFDNIVVTSIDDPGATPTPSPFPSLSPSPTPTPSPTFHAYMQTDDEWKDDIYDHAKKWHNSLWTFERWGCAVTSAAMILRHHGISQLPNGNELHPGTLNAWLTTQYDGYLRAGMVNWNAIARLTKQLQSTHPLWPALEYRRIPSSMPTLVENLQQDRPMILEEPGHFVVAYAWEDPSTIYLRDPRYADRTTLAAYGGTYLSARQFVPSHTNLGSITATADQGVTLVLEKMKTQGKYAPVEAVIFTQQPIRDAVSGEYLGLPFQILEHQQPTIGSYRLKLTAKRAGIYVYQLYFYDQDGQFVRLDGRSLLGNDPQYLVFEYDPTVEKRIIHMLGFDQLIAQIRAAKKAGLLHRAYAGNDLLSLLEGAKKQYPKNRQLAAELFELYQRQLPSRSSVIDQEVLELLRDASEEAKSQLFP